MANIQGFGIQLATGGFSLEANTIFATYAEALAYAQSSAAYVGKVISVTSGDKKGVYSIEAVGANAVLKEVGAKIDLSNYVTKGEISAVYKAKGSVDTFEDLPTNAQVGDVYNVADTGKNYVWVENLVDGESGWDDLAGIIDLSPYATTAAVEGHVATLNGDIAKNAADIVTLNTEVAKKVEAVEGYSLISAEKLALIDTNAADIQALEDKNLDNRIAALEGMFKDGETNIDLSEITASLNDHTSRIGTLESGKVDKGDFNNLSTAVSGHTADIAALVEVNATQTTNIDTLTKTTSSNTTAIAGLTSTVDAHTTSIGTLQTDVATIKADYLKAADIANKVDKDVYEAKVAELAKAASDNLQTAKDYADAAASAVNADLLIEVARAEAAEKANADAIAVEKGRIDALLTGEGVSDAIESFKELQAWIETHEGGAADILAVANKAQEEVDALELVVSGIQSDYVTADANTLKSAKEYTDEALGKLGSAASMDASAFATAEQGAKADAAAPQATTYTKDEVNTNITTAIEAAFAWVDVK